MGMSHKFRLRIMCDRCFKTFGINADKLFTQGNIVSTDNALDISIDGSGFFQVQVSETGFWFFSSWI